MPIADAVAFIKGPGIERLLQSPTSISGEDAEDDERGAAAQIVRAELSKEISRTIQRLVNNKPIRDAIGLRFMQLGNRKSAQTLKGCLEIMDRIRAGYGHTSEWMVHKDALLSTGDPEAALAVSRAEAIHASERNVKTSTGYHGHPWF
jgi:hypothetical protein